MKTDSFIISTGGSFQPFLLDGRAFAIFTLSAHEYRWNPHRGLIADVLFLQLIKEFQTPTKSQTFIVILVVFT